MFSSLLSRRNRIDFAPVAYYYREFFGDEDLAPVTFIPCRQVSTREFDDWDYAMFVKIA